MPRLAFALISVLSHVVAQETRITDPAAAAIGEKARLYELMKAEYLAAGCDAASLSTGSRRAPLSQFCA